MIKVKQNQDYTFKAVLSSGDEEYPGCSFVFAIWKRRVTIALPAITKPDIIHVKGRYNYSEAIERRYGVYLFHNHFNIMWGRGDANFNQELLGPEQRWSCFLPWSEWRQVRHDVYGEQGEFLKPASSFDDFHDDNNTIPKRKFNFLDFDGEEIEAETFIEEREWRRGVKWFKWLSWFSKPKISRSLVIRFNKEVGKKKGSWKGGIVGHSIDLEGEELHKEGFERYCQENGLKFLSEI